MVILFHVYSLGAKKSLTKIFVSEENRLKTIQYQSKISQGEKCGKEVITSGVSKLRPTKSDSYLGRQRLARKDLQIRNLYY